MARRQRQMCIRDSVYLLAEYNNGKFAMTKSKVKVTIGGCGG